MKKKSYLKALSQVLSVFLSVMAVLTGGGFAMAAAGLSDVGRTTADPDGVGNGSTGNADVDPNAGTPMEQSTPDSPQKGIDQQSHAATGSVLDQAELTENHIDDYVKKFRAYRFPLSTDMWGRARQIKVDTKEPTNWEVGEAVMELTTIGSFGTAVVNGYANGNEEVTVDATKIAKNDWKLLRKNATIMVADASGYENGIADGTPLILFVVDKDSSGITLKALNGPWKAANNKTVVVPQIAAGTTLYPMAPALSESEVEIEPNNAYPIETTCYLQKKVCAITYTELFQRIKKKAQWNVQDIKDWNLEMFRRECTRSMLISAPSKFYKHNERTGTETCYTEKGILRQLRLGYELTDGQIDFEDMIGIQAMLCGKYDTPNELTAYCGTKFIQRLLNIDFSKHKEYTVRNYTDESTKIKITSFESNFGKLNFVHEYGLDDLGYSECAVIFSPEEAKHFYYQKGKTININHEKGEGGEVREAKSQYYIKDDCVKLDTFNSMIVGPSTLVGGYKLSALDAVIKSVNTLADVANPAAGDIVYLVGDYTEEVAAVGTEGQAGYVAAHTVDHAMGLYEYDGNAWQPYNGKSIFVG